MTQAGLGTVIVKVDNGNDSTSVTLDKIIRPARGGRAIFYDVTPGKYDVTVRVPYSVFYSSVRVKVIADKTVTVNVSAPESSAFPSPTPFGN